VVLLVVGELLVDVDANIERLVGVDVVIERPLLRLPLLAGTQRRQRRALFAGQIIRIGTVLPLELQVLTDGFVEQSHCAPKPYLPLPTASPASRRAAATGPRAGPISHYTWSAVTRASRGYSSVGRAPGSHPGGRGFESP
jgi:hypothetical protein